MQTNRFVPFDTNSSPNELHSCLVILDDVCLQETQETIYSSFSVLFSKVVQKEALLTACLYDPGCQQLNIKDT